MRGLRHLLPRGLAAHVLVQQSVRRVPGVRRHRLAGRDRSGPARAESGALAQGRRAGAVGGARDVVLPSDPGSARQAPSVLARDPVVRAAPPRARRDPPRRARRRIRGRRQDARAPLSRDLVRGGAGRGGAVHDRAPVPGLWRLAPSAGIARRQDRRPVDRRGRAADDQGGGRLLRRAQPDRARGRDRAPRAQGDPRAARLPDERRPRLPDARSPGRHVIGRRRTANSSGDSDWIEPRRSPVHPGRAVDWTAPARQPAAPRHAQAAA